MRANSPWQEKPGILAFRLKDETSFYLVLSQKAQDPLRAIKPVETLERKKNEN